MSLIFDFDETLPAGFGTEICQPGIQSDATINF
jgi:hypothetical protein